MHQFLMYGIVGLGGTGCHYLVLLLLVEGVGLGAVLSSSFGFLVGALANHELNRHFVFVGTTVNWKGTLGRFFSVACVGFLLNLGIMFLMNSLFSVYYLLSQFIATLTVFLMTFAFNKMWTFRV